MTVLHRASHTTAEDRLGVFYRRFAFPTLAAAVITVSADVRMPIGLPGHRGLIWLTLLVAVALTSLRPSAVLAVGATASAATLLLHTGPGPARYLAAAALLAGMTAVPWIRRRPWLIVVAAAPIHLVALAGSISALAGGRLHAASAGLGDRVLWHLGFGVVAGLLGALIAFCVDRSTPR